jgi:hypothetical protein
MATLTSRYPNATYGNLLLIDNSNAGIDATLRYVQDGEGTNSTLQLSTTAVNIVSGFKYNGNAISIAGALTFSGAYAFTATLTAATSVTFPTSGTLIGTAPGTAGNVLTSNGSAWVSSALGGAGGTSMICSGSSGTPTFTSTETFLMPGSLGTPGTNFGGALSIPFDCVVSDLYVVIGTADASDALTVTLEKNGSASALACTVNATQTTASDTSDTVSLSAGDTLRLKFASNGSQTTSVQVSFKMLLV